MMENVPHYITKNLGRPLTTNRQLLNPDDVNDLAAAVRLEIDLWRTFFIGNAYFSGFDCTRNLDGTYSFGYGVCQVLAPPFGLPIRCAGVLPITGGTPYLNVNWVGTKYIQVWANGHVNAEIKAADTLDANCVPLFYIYRSGGGQVTVRDMRLAPGRRRFRQLTGTYHLDQVPVQQLIADYGDGHKLYYCLLRGSELSLPSTPEQRELDLEAVHIPNGYALLLTTDFDATYFGGTFVTTGMYEATDPDSIHLIGNYLAGSTFSNFVCTRTGWSMHVHSAEMMFNVGGAIHTDLQGPVIAYVTGTTGGPMKVYNVEWGIELVPANWVDISV